MTIFTQKIEELNNIKTDIGDAIIEKGGDIENISFSEYSEAIRNLKIGVDEEWIKLNYYDKVYCDPYFNYIDDLKWVKPTLSFTVQDYLSGTFEVGVSVVGDKLITNSVDASKMVENGYLTIKGSGIVTTNIDYNVSKSVKFNLVTNTPTTYSISIEGKDKKNNTISSSKSFNTLYPCFVGVSSVEVEPNTVYNTFSKQMVANPTSISYTATPSNEYIYIIVPSNKTVNSVTGNGFALPLSDEVKEINITNKYNTTFKYKVYRSFNSLKGSFILSVK